MTINTQEPVVQIRSAGTNASDGHPMAVPMEMILEEMGIDSTHRSRRLDLDMLDWADLVLLMTLGQKMLLMTQVPHFVNKLATLKEYIGHGHIPDIVAPHGTDLESYRQCVAEIDTACDHLLTKLQILNA